MHPDLLELLQSLRSHEVEFLIVGSTALAVHARPRYTEDLDLWIRRSEQNTRRLFVALQEFGVEVSEETLRPFWQEDRQMISLGAKPQAVDLLNFLGEDDFEQVWAGHVEAPLGGFLFPVIGLREFVRSKRVAGRPKDKADLAILEEIWGELPE